jgi:hypothetical protein
MKKEQMIKMKQLSNVIESWLSDNCGETGFRTPAMVLNAQFVEADGELGVWRQNS